MCLRPSSVQLWGQGVSSCFLLNFATSMSHLFITITLKTKKQRNKIKAYQLCWVGQVNSGWELQS